MLDWLSGLITPLNTVLFHLGNDAVSWAELLGFITGAVCVYFTVRASIHNFWTGLLNSAFFLVLFATSHLWADAGLQVVYLALGVAGWWQWLHGGAGRTALVVSRASLRELAGCALFVVTATVGLTALLRHADDPAPFLDALTASLSLAATYLLNAKKVETWYFWIAADCIYVPLYFTKHLDLTGIVYVVFLALAITGLRQWTAEHRAQSVALSVTRAPEPLHA